MGMFGTPFFKLLPVFSSSVDLSDSMPTAEVTAGAAGGADKASRGDHAHPRLTSSHSGLVLDGGGQLPVTFTRTFTTKPAIVVTPVSAAASPPVMVVKSFTMANGLYTGCVIQGWQAQAVTVSILGATVNAFSGNASGVEFTLTAIQTS